MTTTTDGLRVWADGSVMGEVTRTRSGLRFRYEASWLDRDGAFPLSLALPLRPHAYTGDTLLNVLDNLLPDDLGVRQAVARQVGAAGADVYGLLEAIGRDCVGALQFLPPNEAGWQGGPPDGAPISDEEIAALVRSLGDRPLGVTRDTGIRISVAGAQAKTSLLLMDGRWYLPRGPTPSTHLLKPPIGRTGAGVDLSNSVENEFLCLELVRALGVPAAVARINDFDGTKALVVERFDRERTAAGIRRRPQEDLCQALGLPSSAKYEADGGPGAVDLLEYLYASDEPLRDRERLFRALFAFWLLGATDVHAKNFSVALGPGASFKLTPVYDVMSLEPSVQSGDVRQRDYRTALAVGANRHYRVNDIVPRHFVQTARRAGIDETQARTWMAEVASRVPTAIEAVTHAARTHEATALLDAIASGMTKRSALVEMGA